MHELPPENQNENPEKIDFEELSFEELKEASEKIAELSKSSFKEKENKFENINENGITIGKRKNKYKITGLSDSLKDFHYYILDRSNDKLREGFDSKGELIQEIRKMIEKTGNRIIE